MLFHFKKELIKEELIKTDLERPDEYNLIENKLFCLDRDTGIFISEIILVDVTRKYIESQQSSSTVPFGWDDVADAKMLGEIAVSSFNQVGGT